MQQTQQLPKEILVEKRGEFGETQILGNTEPSEQLNTV